MTLLAWKQSGFSNAVLVIAALGALAAVSYSQSDYENCTTDYKTLEKALLDKRNNVYKLMTTFFPPSVDSPLYVTVTYNFPNENINYIWTTVSVYLIIHPRLIRYLSLFFCYGADERIVELELQLPEECSELANNTRSDATNFLFVLTQRVRLCSMISICMH